MACEMNITGENGYEPIGESLSSGLNDGQEPVVVLKAETRYEELLPSQRWVADTREASRRYGGDVFVARVDQPTLAVYLDFFSMSRRGKRVGLVEVSL